MVVRRITVPAGLGTIRGSSPVARAQIERRDRPFWGTPDGIACLLRTHPFRTSDYAHRGDPICHLERTSRHCGTQSKDPSRQREHPQPLGLLVPPLKAIKRRTFPSGAFPIPSTGQKVLCPLQAPEPPAYPSRSRSPCYDVSPATFSESAPGPTRHSAGSRPRTTASACHPIPS